MKKWWMGALAMAVAATAYVPVDVEAKRLGGGRSQGMQRSTPTAPPQRTPDQAPGAPAAPTQSANPGAAGAATAPAAAGRRSWMGPVAGLAAGLGLAALASHLGLGPAFANILTVLLLALVAVVTIRWLMRRASGGGSPALRMQGAAAGGAFHGSAGAGVPPPLAPRPAAPTGFGGIEIGSRVPASFNPQQLDAPSAPRPLPADFDAEGFERLARMTFLRLQAANDAGDLNDLRQFTTPEMYAALQLDLHDRAGRPQHTDVQRVDAQVLDVAEEDGRRIVSVRFHGDVREDAGGPVEPFDEVWHLVAPSHGQGPWAIAGIQQRH